MIVITVVSLYTVRITIEILGLEDYGLFNLIGGIVGLLSIITTTLTTSTQRFLSYELGKENYGNYSKYFSVSIIIFVFLALLITIGAEFFLPSLIKLKLQIPADRLNACIRVFEISILIFSANLIAIPFSSSIIAHEKMSFYAYLSILESILKLLVVYLLTTLNGDKLVIYTWLLFCVSALITLLNILYAHIKFNVCKFSWQWDKNFIKQFFSFIGWNSFGAITSVLTIQGITIIINIFFGAIANAAKAIADRIFNTVFLLVSNIILAATPQITKEVASKEYTLMIPTFYSISRLSYYLIYIIVIPCCLTMNSILRIWLGKNDCTQLMIILSQITLVSMLFSALETPISMIVRANGNIKRYQITNGLISILLIPLTILVYVHKFPPYSYAIIQAFLLFISLFPRIYILKKLFSNCTIEYYKSVVKPILKVSLISLSLVIPVYYILSEIHNSIWLFLYATIIVGGSIYVFGTDIKEKAFIRKIIKSNIIFLHKQ